LGLCKYVDELFPKFKKFEIKVLDELKTSTLVQIYRNVFARQVRNFGKNDRIYKPCPESKDRKVLNMYNVFNLQKRHCE